MKSSLKILCRSQRNSSMCFKDGTLRCSFSIFFVVWWNLEHEEDSTVAFDFFVGKNAMVCRTDLAVFTLLAIYISRE